MDSIGHCQKTALCEMTGWPRKVREINYHPEKHPHLRSRSGLFKKEQIHPFTLRIITAHAHIKEAPNSITLSTKF